MEIDIPSLQFFYYKTTVLHLNVLSSEDWHLLLPNSLLQIPTSVFSNSQTVLPSSSHQDQRNTQFLLAQIPVFEILHYLELSHCENFSQVELYQKAASHELKPKHF